MRPNHHIDQLSDAFLNRKLFGTAGSSAIELDQGSRNDQPGCNLGIGDTELRQQPCQGLLQAIDHGQYLAAMPPVGTEQHDRGGRHRQFRILQRRLHEWLEQLADATTGIAALPHAFQGRTHHGLPALDDDHHESLVLPMTAWLLDQGVRFQYGTDVDFEFAGNRKRATRIHWEQDLPAGGVDLGPEDYVLMTSGSLVDNAGNGDHHTPAVVNRGPASAWDLWRRIARKDPSFGHPEVFCSSIDETKWQSATVTTLDERIPEYIRAICKRDPFSGRVVTGGIVTARDSSWLRTGLKAAYQLIDIERGVPEVFNSTWDIRTVLNAAVRLRDGKQIELPHLPLTERLFARARDTAIGKLMIESGLI